MNNKNGSLSPFPNILNAKGDHSIKIMKCSWVYSSIVNLSYATPCILMNWLICFCYRCHISFVILLDIHDMNKCNHTLMNWNFSNMYYCLSIDEISPKVDWLNRRNGSFQENLNCPKSNLKLHLRIDKRLN